MLFRQRIGLFFCLSGNHFIVLTESPLIFGRNRLCSLPAHISLLEHKPFRLLAWPTKRDREQSVERVSTNLLPAIFLCIGHTFNVGFLQNEFSVFFSFGIFFFLEAVVKAALFVVGEVGAIQVVINPSPVYLHHLRLICQSRRRSTRLPVRASPKGRLRTFPFPSLSSIGGFYTPALLTHTSTYLIVWHAIRFLIFIQSVFLLFTSIWMRFLLYCIRWSFPFVRWQTKVHHSAPN